ncbi:MAG: hypothetical protein ACO1N4_00590 [Pedobacter sp.]
MPDKDFDKLFKDSFMDAEIEPSANLWGNIAEQLEPQKKRSFPILWVAAASVAVVASVLLFTQGGDKVYLQGAAVETAAVKPVAEVQTLPVAVTEEVIADVTPEREVATSNRNFLKREVVKSATAPIEEPQKNNFIAMQPSEKNEHLVIKRGEVKPLDVTPVEEVIANSKTETVYANNVTKQDFDYLDDDVEANTNKKGIRNVGDLVNYVVDKVDKRDKKIIKFDTDDDDNSSIIGLNIGFLKLNKKNK